METPLVQRTKCLRCCSYSQTYPSLSNIQNCQGIKLSPQQQQTPLLILLIYTSYSIPVKYISISADWKAAQLSDLCKYAILTEMLISIIP